MLGIANVDPGHGAIHVIAELTLILVLFSDAARINLAQLRRDHNLPLRMPLIGLPLIGLPLIHGRRGVGGAGAVSAARFWEAVLLAALLAPTDAVLGQYAQAYHFGDESSSLTELVKS